ncbi:M24 family metallopeptidase [Streptomyces reniochalinae]|uniref:Xaa-Pro aminopeptidase n=1 Tax=Streptomyces reniochalinae TaxID=2250578 RepID=A0A367EII7_9ACTN|nr:M24 family metallopeptidase [Streptomyces reniochalinae]RCG17030.1 Xaa-Pro aminopeptidase [Streptomyces reniochalinae]
MRPATSEDAAADLRGYRKVQQLAYACAESVAARLKPGMTEREAARMPREWPRERGGRTAEAGYSGCLGPHPVHERLTADLRAHRELILARVRERRPLREISAEVDRLMRTQGYAGRHRAHPFGVRAHRVARAPHRGRPPAVRGRGTGALKGRARGVLRGHGDGRLPRWSPSRRADHPPRTGLWEVEARLGFRGTGAKFEEILVVTDSRDPQESAFWLEDDLPHVRRWQEEAQAV